ncbi:MAG: rRNA maturation RNase YbeY [Alphaproteobacteria bacterium]
MGTRKREKVPCLAVEVTRRCELWGDVPGDAELARAARAAFEAVSGTANCEISLLLTSDEEICALNKSWRGKDEPTNVLSFPLGEMAQENNPKPLGDVVLACETVTREAETRGIELGQHSAHLVVHGVLHLLGYDHAIDCEAEKMENLETRILKSLGLPDPYSFDMMRNGKTK